MKRIISLLLTVSLLLCAMCSLTACTEAEKTVDIVFVTHDGETVVKTVLGETPQAPTVASYQTADYLYKFTGWNLELTPASGAKTYTAEYEECELTYVLNATVTNAPADADAVVKFRQVGKNMSLSLTLKAKTGKTADEAWKTTSYKVRIVCPDAWEKVAYRQGTTMKQVTPTDLDGVKVATLNVVADGTDVTIAKVDAYEASAGVASYKNGAKGVFTFTFDDGLQSVANWLVENYPDLPVSFSIYGTIVATLKTVKSNDKFDATSYYYDYVLDKDGKYEYTVNQATVDFWQNVLKTMTNAEINPHTMTHAHPGNDDSGGLLTYPTYNNAMTSNNFPRGSVTAEFAAVQQIFTDLFGKKSSMFSVDAGTGTARTEYHWTVTRQYYLGSRSTSSTLITYQNLNSRLYSFPGWMTVTPTAADAGKTLEQTKADKLQSWKEYILSAVTNKAWGGFCIHGIDTMNHITSSSDMKAMIDYALTLSESGDLWLATLSDAALYMMETAQASAQATRNGDTISVSVTTELALDEDCYTELTAKVAVPMNWKSATYTDHAGNQIETSVFAENGQSYIYVNVYPNGTAVSVQGNK